MMQAATFFRALPVSAENVLAGTSSPIKGQSETEFSELFSQIEGLTAQDGKEMEATPEGLIAQATMLDLLLAQLPKPAMGAKATPDGEIAPMAMVDLDRIKENLPVITEAIFGENSIVGDDKAKLLLQSMMGVSGDSSHGMGAKTEPVINGAKIGGIISLLTRFDGTKEELTFEIQSLLYETDGTRGEGELGEGSGIAGALTGETIGGEQEGLSIRHGSETKGHVIDPSTVTNGQTQSSEFRFIHEHKDKSEAGGKVTEIGRGTVEAEQTTTGQTNNIDRTGIDQSAKAQAKGVSAAEISRLPMKEAIETVKYELQQEAIAKTQAQESKVVAEATAKVENQAVREQAQNFLAKGGKAVVQPATEANAQVKAKASRARTSETKVEATQGERNPAKQAEIANKAVIEKPEVGDQLLKKGPSIKESGEDTIDFEKVGKSENSPAKTEFNVGQATPSRDASAPVNKAIQVQVTVGEVSEVVKEVSDLIAARRPGKMEVLLNPEDLGTINIAVQQTGSRTDIEIQASDERVRHVLNVHRQDMVQSLESKGMTVGNVNLGDAPQTDVNAQANSQQQQQTSRKEFEQAVNLRASNEAGMQKANNDRPAYRSTTQVDYTA